MPRQTQAIETTEITYPSSGTNVEAILHQPLQLTHPAPVVVFCPGGGGDEMRTMATIPTTLATHGYVTLTIGYRGSAWDDDDDDIRAAIDYLLSRDGVDPARIAVVGHFRGAAAALRTASKEPRVRSVVSLAAPTFLAQWVSGVRELSPVNYADRVRLLEGVPEEQTQRFADLAPLFKARGIKVPVLLVHGTADLFVPLDHAVWMYVQLGQTGNPMIRLELVPWAGHYFDDVLSGRYVEGTGLTGSFKEHAAQLALDWLDDTLGRRY